MLLADCGLRLSGLNQGVISAFERCRRLVRVGRDSPQVSEDQIDFSKVDMSKLMSTNFTRFALNKLSVALNLTEPEAETYSTNLSR